MPEWPCPAFDGYTAKGTTEKETAEVLVEHLIEAHCKTPLPTRDSSNYELIDQLDDVNVQAKVKGPVDARVRGEHR